MAGERFVYRSTPKTWMNQCSFFEWLRDFDAFIAQRPDRRVLLLVDNASCHGADGNLPDLMCTEVMFLPAGTTSRIQPLDAGIIGCLKRRYCCRQLKRAIDLLEEGVTESLYRTDIYIAMKEMYDVCYRVEDSAIPNCWTKTGLLSQHPP